MKPMRYTLATFLLVASTSAFAQSAGSWLPPHQNFPYWGVNRNWYPFGRPGVRSYDDGYFRPWRGGVGGYEPYEPRRGHEYDSTFRSPCCPEPVSPREYSSPDMPLPDYWGR